MPIPSLQSEAVALSWRVRQRPSITTVSFFGEIDENADFRDLLRHLEGRVVFDLSDVRRMNSMGVREWINFVGRLPNVDSLTFSRCSIAIVTQLNMIHNFRGNATIRSFYAPYTCDGCNNEEEKLIYVIIDFPKGDADHVPPHSCSACRAEMMLDDLPERYLSFLTES